MQNHQEVSRRIFLERLAAGALVGATGACNRPVLAQSGSGGWTPPPVMKNPNIHDASASHEKPEHSDRHGGPDALTRVDERQSVSRAQSGRPAEHHGTNSEQLVQL